MEIFKLFGSVLIDNDKANQSLDSTDKKAEGLSGKLGGMIGTAAKWGAAIGAGALIVGGAMLAVASKASDAASAINDMSVRTGISTDTLQELKFASDQVGVNFESITNASGKLNKMMADAASGSKAAKESFGELGVEVTGSDGKLRAMGDVFPEVIAKLADMENKSERNALAMKVFGKGAVELVPLLDQGSGGIAELTQKAHDLGLVMGEDAISAGDKFGDSLDAVKATVGALGTEVGIAFMPIIQKLLDWIIVNMPAIKETATKVFEAIKTVVVQVWEVFKVNMLPILMQLYEWIKQNLPAIQAAAGASFGAFIDIVKRLWNIFNDNLLPILKALYRFIEPTFPLIGAIIKSAFDIVIGIVNGVIDVFETVTRVIRTAIDWLKSFNGTPVKDKQPKTGVGFVDNRTNKSGLLGFAEGTNFVQRDMTANIHKGELIVPAKHNPYNPNATDPLNNKSTEQEETTISIIEVTTPVYLQDKVIASSTSRIQVQNNRGKARALGVIPI